MRKKIAVTGAGGYIGRHVVKKLLDLGADVTAVDRNVCDVDERATKLELNLFEENSHWFETLGAPDACLHMAWRDGFVHNAPSHMEDLSIHVKFIRNMVEGGLKQLAVMGSMHEVGRYEGKVNENTPCMPNSNYAIAKDALRRYTMLLGELTGVKVQWLRAYYIFGDDQWNHSIFAKLQQAEQEGKTEFPFTSGKNKYDFLHIDTLSQQIAACIMQNEITGIINCCSGEPISLADKVEGYIAEHDLHIKLQYGAYPDRAYDSPAIWGDATKIEHIMNICHRD